MKNYIIHQNKTLLHIDFLLLPSLKFTIFTYHCLLGVGTELLLNIYYYFKTQAAVNKAFFVKINQQQ